jgi:endonuclease I
VVGEVNALRSDLPMGVLDAARGSSSAAASSFGFGACQSAIDHGVFMPRRDVRGDLARAYKYMDRSYPDGHLIDDAHRTVFDACDREAPRTPGSATATRASRPARATRTGSSASDLAALFDVRPEERRPATLRHQPLLAKMGGIRVGA